MRLKICDSHLICKVANKCLNVRERVVVVEWNNISLFSQKSAIYLQIYAYIYYQKTLEYSSLENSYLHQTMGQGIITDHIL